MKIHKIKVINFRNYDKLELEFNPCKNIIIGRNGSGKTNIVEAIYVLALTKSFRGTREDVIIKHDKDITRIEGEVKDKRKESFKVILDKNKKTVKKGNKVIKRISDYISNINVVLFTSEDLKLIKDTPNTRRKLINVELSQFSNEYLKYLTLYNKIMKQRNMYLKTLYLNGNASKEYLDIITNQLVNYGIKIYEYRKEFIDDISIYITDIYKSITGKNNLKLVYKSDYLNKTKEGILKAYKRSTNSDIKNGQTSLGIHKDDFDFSLNEVNLKDFGSEGEQKNAIIALKLAELELFKNKKGIIPILILDDLYSELDKVKINNILNFINEDTQTFITTTEITKLSSKLKRGSKVFKVKDGIVEEVKYEK
jgi:DNA replication and repair protein RecF